MRRAVVRRHEYQRAGWYGVVVALCADYNQATNPYAMRTLHEHHRFGQLAVAVRNRLRRMGADVFEAESGRLYPPFQV